MTGIHCAEEADGFLAAQLAQQDSVWPQAQGGLEKIVGVDHRFSELTFYGDQAEVVGTMQLHLCRVLNDDHALVHGNLAQERVQECRLTGGCAAADQDRLPVPDSLAKKADGIVFRYSQLGRASS